MRILITAGPTWAKVDSVRILTNRFSGKTGLYLAKYLKKKGHAVTLAINPQAIGKVEGINVFYFHYFAQLKKILEDLLKNNYFDAVIHSAAVNDYLPRQVQKGKFASGKNDWQITFKPAPKLIKIIRKKAKNSLLVQFKLEEKKKGLVDKAYRSLKANCSDYVVANALEDLDSNYKAYLIDPVKKTTFLKSKAQLAKILCKIISKR